jgi:AcrR family transcriptional regulator
MDGASALFDVVGYSGASMADIAAAVGLAKPSLYHYFGSKSEILSAIHDDFIDALLDGHARRLELGLPPAHLLLEVIVDILELMDTHRGYVRVFFENHRELPPEARRKMRAKRNQYEAFVEQLLVKGVENGDFRNVDTRLATLAIFGMCNWAYQWYLSGGRLKPREISYTFFDLVTEGMSPRPPARGEDGTGP